MGAGNSSYTRDLTGLAVVGVVPVSLRPSSRGWTIEVKCSSTQGNPAEYIPDRRTIQGTDRTRFEPIWSVRYPYIDEVSFVNGSLTAKRESVGAASVSFLRFECQKSGFPESVNP
jgi:hypothetical protein